METFSDLFNTTPNHQTGFRLQYLEVLNWGTFTKACWKIEPNGNNALLTGDIGSGKSTLVDALTCLLVPHHKIIFNKAAGAEVKERDLISYIKGEYKKEKEAITRAAKKVYLRPDNDTYTVLIGNFHNQGYEEDVCLAQLFWIGKEGKVEKLLIIGNHPLSVQEHFGHFTDINDLRRRLRKTEGIELCKNFSQYSKQFRRRFGMHSEKAIDLFYQTVSMKAVSSLTNFVRDQMLERTDVKEQITALLKRFDDLNKAHAAVVHAREQHQILKPLDEACTAYEQVKQQITDVETMLEVMPAWFAAQKWTLLDKAIAADQNELEKVQRKQKLLTAELEELEDRKQAIIQDIANNGGKRIEQIDAEIKRHEADKATKQEEFGAYERIATQCGLKKIQNEADFLQNITAARELNIRCEQEENNLREKRDQAVSSRRQKETDFLQENEELQSLKDRKTQIPGWLISFRSQLCEDLRIAETDLPFAGELLQVHQEERAWEGAIERILHDTAISLLVPPEHYPSVKRYVNDNALRSPDGRGMKLTFLETDTRRNGRATKALESDSLVYKIAIKPDTPFYDWLEQYLQHRFGDCMCTDVDGLQHVPYGITRQGLIKSGRIRHTKDDRRSLRDRRNYVLGWSNVEKIKVLEASVSALEAALQQLQSEISALEASERENQQLQRSLEVLLHLSDYSRINWQHHSSRIYALEKERDQLLHNNDILAKLEESKAAVYREIVAAREKDKAYSEQNGGLKTRIATHEEQKASAGQQQAQCPEAQRAQWFPWIANHQTGPALSLRNVDKRQEEFRKQYQGEDGSLKKLRGRLFGYHTAIERKMHEIKIHSRSEYDEFSENIDAREEYRRKFKQLTSEDLKRHEERFKEELNKNVINSIAVFDSQLQKHETDIKQKINTINQHLSEIVYNAAQDTYITILMEATTNKEVRLFREDLKRCYIHSFTNTQDLYTEEKYEQVKRILDRFASMEPLDKEWTNTVTDVRQWFAFNASERYRKDESEKEFYEGSGGKSGGQKEKLAYTILASALAYQFGLQFGESKSHNFRFVVIDEAFGRGSDESTRYGLELFKKLNLQLLIVTPLQKLHVIEGHVNSFHFISNRTGNDSQVSNLSKEEYELQKARHLGIATEKIES